MRKYLVDGAKWLYAFFILSVGYCMIQDIVSFHEKIVFRYSLLFLPVLIGCSVAVKKVKHVIQYFLIAAILLGLVYVGSNLSAADSINRVILMTFSVFAVFAYFAGRAAKKICWLENPHYLILPYYLLVCFYGGYFQKDFLIRLCALAAGFSYLIVELCTNEGEMGNFIQDYANLERLPVQRMQQNNNRMFWGQAFVKAGVMAAAPYLKVDELVYRIAKLLRSLLVFLLSLLGRASEEQIMEQGFHQEKMDMGFPPIEEKESWLMQLIEKILEIAGWIVFWAVMAAFLYLIIRKLMQLYQQFNERTEENGDIVENLMSLKTEDKVRLKERRKDNLFFNLSPEAKIRKHYRKKVLKENRSEIRNSWTPQQLEEAVNLSLEQKAKFHYYYEKARYSKDGCTKEEAQEMTEI